jgi:hypothetical protein
VAERSERRKVLAAGDVRQEQHDTRHEAQVGARHEAQGVRGAGAGESVLSGRADAR